MLGDFSQLESRLYDNSYSCLVTHLVGYDQKIQEVIQYQNLVYQNSSATETEQSH